MASFAIVTLTPITMPKKASSIKSTMRPVSLRCEGRLDMKKTPRSLGRDEMVGGGGDDAEPDVGDVEVDRDRFLRVALLRRGDEQAELGGGIARNHDLRPGGRDRIDTHHMHGGVDRAVDVESDDAFETALVEQADRVGV